MTLEDIGYAVRAFIGDDKHPVFWGYFPAYDWVVFSWLFGGMHDLPFSFPQLCLDIKQWAIGLGDPDCQSKPARRTTLLPMRNGRKRPGIFLRAFIPKGATASLSAANTRVDAAEQIVLAASRLSS